MTEPHFPLTIAEASDLLGGGLLSAEDLTLAVLDKIAGTDASTNAFVTVAADQALAAARAADDSRRRGDRVGPLHGIPIAVKDNIDVSGMVTAAGSAFLRASAERDATAVVRLRHAGAIIVGKTNLHEFAWGGTTENEHFGATRNPWDLDRNAHGSSGGSAAAVAAGFCLGALGTDTGGSIRNPAAVTGLTGLRPTVGRVSNAGVLPVAWSMDTVGPLAGSARDAATLYQVIAGHDRADPLSARVRVGSPAPEPDLSGRRLGLVAQWGTEHVEPGVAAAFQRAVAEMERAGARLVELDLPGLEGHYGSWLIVQMAESAAVHRKLLAEHADQYGRDVRLQLLAGQGISASDYLLAQRYRRHLRSRLLEAFEHVDAILTPTCATTAAVLGADPVQAVLTRSALRRERAVFTSLASAAALPAISMPCGVSAGLPVGLQAITAPFDESGALEIAMAYQSVTDWHQARPALTGR